MKLNDAQKVVESLQAYLSPACTRMEVAGSVRRGKAEVGDIEFVLQPNLDLPVLPIRPEFGQPIPPRHTRVLERYLYDYEKGGMIQMLESGPRKKKFLMVAEQVKVELYINLPPSQWGVQMLIRTGPKEFGHWMVTNKSHGGALPDGYYVKHQVVWDEGKIERDLMLDNPNLAISMLNDGNYTPMPAESDFLTFCGLDWIEPKDRKAPW